MAIMLIIILVDVVAVVAIMYYGAKDHAETHLSIADSGAVQAMHQLIAETEARAKQVALEAPEEVPALEAPAEES